MTLQCRVQIVDSTVQSRKGEQYRAEYRDWTVKYRVQRVDSTMQSTESGQYSAEYI